MSRAGHQGLRARLGRPGAAVLLPLLLATAAWPQPTSPAPVAVPPSAPAPTPEAFETRVRTLDEQVTELKEKVFRTKARLLLLQETVLGGDAAAGARAVIFHKNEMGSALVLESAHYALDGAPVFDKSEPGGDLDKRAEFEVFNGRIAPGKHQLSVRLVYRGSGGGVFSYLEGYKFKVQSSHVFEAESGKVSTLKVVGFEKGGLGTELKDRPAIRYDVEVSVDPTLRPATAAGEAR